MTDKLLSDDILDCEDLNHEDVPVPEWKKGGKPIVIRLCQLDAGTSLKMNDIIAKEKDYPDEGMFIIFIFTARDPVTGERLFPIPTDGTLEEIKEPLRQHIDRLKKKSIRVLNRLQFISLKLNSMKDEQKTELKNVSSEAVTGDSPTASHEN